eukprot:s296_g53.t1
MKVPSMVAQHKMQIVWLYSLWPLVVALGLPALLSRGGLIQVLAFAAFWVLLRPCATMLQVLGSQIDPAEAQPLLSLWATTGFTADAMSLTAHFYWSWGLFELVVRRRPLTQRLLAVAALAAWCLPVPLAQLSLGLLRPRSAVASALLGDFLGEHQSSGAPLPDHFLDFDIVVMALSKNEVGELPDGKQGPAGDGRDHDGRDDTDDDDAESSSSESVEAPVPAEESNSKAPAAVEPPPAPAITAAPARDDRSEDDEDRKAKSSKKEKEKKEKKVKKEKRSDNKERGRSPRRSEHHLDKRPKSPPGPPPKRHDKTTEKGDTHSWERDGQRSHDNEPGRRRSGTPAPIPRKPCDKCGRAIADNQWSLWQHYLSVHPDDIHEMEGRVPEDWMEWHKANSDKGRARLTSVKRSGYMKYERSPEKTHRDRDRTRSHHSDRKDSRSRKRHPEYPESRPMPNPDHHERKRRRRREESPVPNPDHTPLGGKKGPDGPDPGPSGTGGPPFMAGGTGSDLLIMIGRMLAAERGK